MFLAKIKSAFEINNIKQRDVTMLHAMWLGDIAIRHTQVSGSVAGDGDHSLKWITAPRCAQWHS